MPTDADIVFDAAIIEWRGPAPFFFAPVPEAHFGAIRHAAMTASYGWGVVPVVARVGTSEFATSLFPRAGSYLLPIKLAVQTAEGVGLGDRIRVRMRVGRPDRR